ncbi:DUF4007 family protein [Shewanella sp. Isolate13]|uniref:DUF4007 family protein n=1 Tax=Shewanella sp. Isolate13 TaxID=2908531 RepID=UPI001EFDBA03|nr:DUF4007 family protein [Shewanella sp. Isolate13]MCG9730946.1 DUF4007 family protein [Shewanella sp. Isolate13]
MSNFTAKFSGHQTFPLRYGWLYKYAETDTSKLNQVDELMVEWGVGKNMVEAIKYWARQAGAEQDIGPYSVVHSNDPYLENIESLWIIHWLLCHDHLELTSIKVFFNYYNGLTVDRGVLFDFLQHLFSKQNFIADTKKAQVLKAPSDSSLKKDLGVLFLMYTSSTSSKKTEDSFASPLSELGLIKQVDKSSYSCELEERVTLSNEVFTFCVLEYFCYLKERNKLARTLAFDSFLMAPGSPARIFRMSQSEVERRLDAVAKLTNGAIDWTDTQGLRQIQITDESVLSKDSNLAFLKKMYK